MKKHRFNIFPEMQPEDYSRLKNDLQLHGYDDKQPIYLYEAEILDGWNRYQACEDLAIKPVFTTFIGDETEALDFVMRTNKRRNLNSGQWAFILAKADELVVALKGIVDKDRRAKQAISLAATHANKEFGVTDKKLPQTIIEPVRVSNILATTYDTNRTYINHAKKLLATNPELSDRVISGEISMSKAIQETKRADVIAKLESIEVKEAKVMSGKYDVIVLDPPWPMEKIERDVRPNQVNFDYPTMSEAELSDLNIPFAENCHVWVWTTHKFLPMALRLLDKWGMKYVCAFIWHKNGGFQPIGLPQYNCEFAIYARIGTPVFVETKALPLCFNAERTGHSEKPAEFYNMVNRVTAGRRLDMFNRRLIDGFDGWGKEASSERSFHPQAYNVPSSVAPTPYFKAR